MDVLTRPLAVSSLTSRHVLPEGLTIDEALDAARWDRAVDPWTVVTIDGREVPASMWTRVRPKPGRELLVGVRPAGGGGRGKQAMQMVAMVAVMVVAAYVAGPLGAGAWVGGSSVLGIGTAAGSALVTGAITLAGSLLIAQLFKPPRLARAMAASASLGNAPEESRTYGVSGAQNTLQPYAVVPRLYGRHRYTPPLCAEPYVVSSGPAQTLYLLLDLGHGPLLVEDIRIGNTPIGDFETVQWRIHPVFQAGTELKFYVNDQASTEVNAVLTEGIDNVRTVPQQGSVVTLDFTFPGGLVEYDEQGRPKERVERISVYAASPSAPGDWRPIGQFSPYGVFGGVEGTGVEGERQVAGFGVQYGRSSTRSILTADPAGGAVRVGHRAEYKGEDYFVTGINSPPVPPIAGVTPTLQWEIILDRFPPGGSDFGTIAFFPDGEQMVFFGTSSGAASGPLTVSFGPGPWDVQFRGKSRSPRTVGVVLNMAADDWSILVRRDTPVSNSTLVSNAIAWTVLRSARLVPPIAPREPHTVMEVRVTASESISGQVSNINALCTSILWDSRRGAKVASRNPAVAYADVLTGAANPRRVPWNRLDVAALEAWADACDAPRNPGDPFATLDLVVDYRTTVGELCQSVAAIGRAAPTMVGGLYSVLVESDDRVPVQLFTNRNTSGMSAVRTFIDVPHGVKVRYIDERTWERGEVVAYDDGQSLATATKYETLDLPGITRGAQAWRAGRYYLAAGKLRRERLTVSADIEHVVCQRGDLVRVAHESLLGNAVARVRSISGTLVVTDADFSAVAFAGAVHAEFRTSAGVILDPVPATFSGGIKDRFTVAAPIAAQLAPGDVVALGTLTTTASDWLVDTVRPGPDLSAALELIEYAPAVLDADRGEIPEYVPAAGSGFLDELNPVRFLTATPAPVTYTAAGLPLLVVSVAWSPPLGYRAPRYLVERVGTNQLDATDLDVLREVADVIAPRFVDQLDGRDLSRAGTTVTYSVTPLSVLGRRGRATSVSVVVFPDMVPPPVVQLGSNVLDDNLLLFWTEPDIPDRGFYQLRFTADPSVIDWNRMVVVARSVPAGTSSLTIPTRPGNYAIRAVDSSGNWGPAGYTRVSVDVLRSTTTAVVTAVPAVSAEDAPDPLAVTWAGTHDRTEIVGGELRLSLRPDGTYHREGWFYAAEDVVLPGVWRVRAVGSIDARGVSAAPGADHEGRWDAQVTVSTVKDLPVLASAWFSPLAHAAPLAADAGNFSPSAPALHTLTEMAIGSFAVWLRSYDGATTPSVTKAQVEWRLDQRTETGKDRPTSAARLSVSYANRFWSAPSLTAVLNDGQPGEQVRKITDDAGGFVIEVRDAAGAPVAAVRHIDWTATGAGLRAAAPLVW